jgi:hypothetical protein
MADDRCPSLPSSRDTASAMPTSTHRLPKSERPEPRIPIERAGPRFGQRPSGVRFSAFCPDRDLAKDDIGSGDVSAPVVRTRAAQVMNSDPHRRATIRSARLERPVAMRSAPIVIWRRTPTSMRLVPSFEPRRWSRGGSEGPKSGPKHRNYRAGYRIRTGDLQLGNKSKRP